MLQISQLRYKKGKPSLREFWTEGWLQSASPRSSLDTAPPAQKGPFLLITTWLWAECCALWTQITTASLWKAGLIMCTLLMRQGLLEVILLVYIFFDRACSSSIFLKSSFQTWTNTAETHKVRRCQARPCLPSGQTGIQQPSARQGQASAGFLPG